MPRVELTRGVKLTVHLSTPRDRRLILSIPGAKLSKDETRAYLPLEPTVIEDMSRLFADTLVLDESVDSWHKQLSSELRLAAYVTTMKDILSAPEYFAALRPYQRVGAVWLGKIRRGILGDAPGLGKTIQAITAARYLKAEKVLVVAPGYLIHDQWERQIRMWHPGATITIAEGTLSKRQKALEVDAQYTLINIEMLRRRDAFRPLWQRTWDVVILDEAHHFQGRTSQQSVGASALNTRALFELTGSPIWNNVDSLWHLLHLIDPNRFSSYWSFVETYCTLRRHPWGLEVVGPNPMFLPRLREIIGPYLLQRQKKDVAPEIPPKLYVNLTYDLSPDQRAIYKKMRKELILESETQTKSYVSRGALISDLRLLCTAPSLLGFEDMTSSKDRLILDLLEDLTGTPTVIFVWYRKYADYLQKLLGRHAIDSLIVSGEQDPVTRSATIQRFREGKANVLIGTIASMSEGLDLDYAKVAIFAELSYIPAINVQAEDRLHRLTTTESPTIYSLYARNTVEERIVDITANKADIIDETLAVQEVLRRLAEESEE